MTNPLLRDFMAVIHAYTDYFTADPDTRRRMNLAQSTWHNQLWRECPVRDEQLPRLWKEEGRQFAYLRDVFDAATEQGQDNDIICYTNADICVCSDCAQRIVLALQQTDACYSYRRDFHHRLQRVLSDEEILVGKSYAGSDLKAFRKWWWVEHRGEMPDMILGLECWDPLMRILIEDTNPGCVVNISDTHYHERHGSYWENPKNRYRLNGQKHCLRLAWNWLKARGKNPAQFGVVKI